MGACRSLLTATILNLAINARNAMPNGGTQEALREHRGDSPRQRRLVIAAVDALLLDQPAAVELHAEIVIEAHGVERPGVGRGKPLHHLPIGAHRDPVRGALERYVLHPVLTAAPPWLGEGLARPAPHGNTLSSRRLH